MRPITCLCDMQFCSWFLTKIKTYNKGIKLKAIFISTLRLLVGQRSRSKLNCSTILVGNLAFVIYSLAVYFEISIALYVLAIISRVTDEQTPVYRPDIDSADSKVNPLLITLMTDCWAEEPTSRPNFDEILKLIRKLNGGKWVTSRHWNGELLLGLYRGNSFFLLRFR